MKTFSLFNTDFYQVSMMLAYIVRGIANENTGFEAFTRRINTKVTDKSGYRFGGESDVKHFMTNIREEIGDPELLETFLALVMPKVKVNKENVEAKVRAEWPNLVKNSQFSFNVAGDFTVVKPMVPVFQYWGPKWIGQLIETPILNTINGPTARYSSGAEEHDTELYYKALVERAKLYRAATMVPLLEGGFRRAPSFGQALLASQVALSVGWNGTSNIAAAQAGLVPYDRLGGTMAHAYVMSFEREIDAFLFWNTIFPQTTYLVDTNDVLQAVQLLIDANIKPLDVRIDCSPLDTLCIETRKILDSAGWKDVGIYPSGDIDPSILFYLTQKRVPFNKTMAGTKYVNPPGFDDQESGFVYKLVQYERDGVMYFPKKNTFEKKNYAGLKNVYAKNDKLIVDCSGDIKWYGFDAYSIRKIDFDAEVVFENVP